MGVGTVRSLGGPCRSDEGPLVVPLRHGMNDLSPPAAGVARRALPSEAGAGRVGRGGEVDTGLGGPDTEAHTEGRRLGATH